MRWGFLLIALMASSAKASDLLDILSNKEEGKKEAGILASSAQDWSDVQSAIQDKDAETTIFFSFLTQGDFEKALFQWYSALKGKSFSQTPNGQALYGYLIFKNGLEVAGLETLLNIQDPTTISAQLIKRWSEAVPTDSKAWEMVDAKWNTFWSQPFGYRAETIVSARNFGAKDEEALVDLLKRTAPNTWERSWVQWRYILVLISKGEDVQAAKILKNLMESKKPAISLDLMNITVARVLYQNGHLANAIEYYSRIPKNSPYWLESQEEAAWSYLRKAEPQNAITISKTLLEDAFTPEVGAETYYMSALANLKVCDYPEVAKDIELFKSRFRKKAENLIEVAKTGKTADTTQMVDRMRKGPTSLIQMGASAQKVPIFAVRDEGLYQRIQRWKALESEAKRAGQLYSRSVGGSSATVGFQAVWEQFKNDMTDRSSVAESLVYSMIRDMANVELETIKKNLSRIQIVEAEVIQQLALSDRVLKDSGKKLDVRNSASVSTSKDTLRFPYDGEIWFDELSNYKVNLKGGCQARNGASL